MAAARWSHPGDLARAKDPPGASTALGTGVRVVFPAMSWCVYMLRCADGSLYTGATNALDRRVALHASGRGARYTRGRGPLRVVYVEPCEDRSEALRRELALKALPRGRKQVLCATPLETR